MHSTCMEIDSEGQQSYLDCVLKTFSIFTNATNIDEFIANFIKAQMNSQTQYSLYSIYYAKLDFCVR